MDVDRLQTGISKVRWCDPAGGFYNFDPAVMKGIKIESDKNAAKDEPAVREMSWFDEIFHGGIVLPKQADDQHRAVTLLITGPPGTGKSTLALELCVRLATRPEKSLLTGKTLYVASEAHPPWMIDNASSFGWLRRARNQVTDKSGNNREETDEEVKSRLFSLGWRHDKAPISICTLEEVKTGVGWVFESLRGVLGLDEDWAHGPLFEQPAVKLGRQRGDHGSSSEGFDLVIIDSLNSVPTDKAQEFTKYYDRFVEGGPRLIVFILDSSPARPVAETWEFAADIVLRLDRNNDSGYMIRTLEVVKARYQAHVWGKHQLKIQEPLKSEDNPRVRPDEGSCERRMRAHPWAEGGIFIFPSIHYILSRYKRAAPLNVGMPPVPTPLPSLNSLLGNGIPAGRTTALLGGRGTHKSHLGHLQALHNVLGLKGKSIILSLRDDEAMTMDALEGILKQHWPKFARFARKKLIQMIKRGQLEIVYYPPGYVTPEEFFHRMLLSIYRMRAQDPSCGITLLFNSLDQIASRFPLCAKERVFVPGIIQTLSSIGVTSVFVGADTEGIDDSLRDLLSMAELILRVTRKENMAKDGLRDILSSASTPWKKDLSKEQRQAVIDSLPESLSITELTVERYAGGKPAGSQGMLELVTGDSRIASVLAPGLQFISYLDMHVSPRPYGQQVVEVQG